MEKVTAHVYYGVKRTPLGKHSFEFISRHESMCSLLQGALDPVKFMCESLEISPADIPSLDSAMAKSFKHNVPNGFTFFGLHDERSVEGLYYREKSYLSNNYNF